MSAVSDAVADALVNRPAPVRGSSLPRSVAKQPGRSEKQRDEEPIETQDLADGAIRGLVHPREERDHGDQRLSQFHGDRASMFLST